MDTKFKNSFFPGLIYWNHNRIHLGTFKKLVFAPMVPPPNLEYLGVATKDIELIKLTPNVSG